MIVDNEHSVKMGVVSLVISVIVLLSVGAVLVAEMTKYTIPPDGAFVVQDKKIVNYKPYPLLFWVTEKLYLYQFNNTDGEYGWVEVPYFVYNNYAAGDQYPNNWTIWR